jgi:hypothetical protein
MQVRRPSLALRRLRHKFPRRVDQDRARAKAGGYWHFKDIDFTPDGTPLPAADPADFVTQLKLMIAALPASSGASDDVRSYDLVWILYLVGDAHQPLHAAARYTLQIPDGDAGGNAESVIPASGSSMALHAYWDAIFGGYSSP